MDLRLASLLFVALAACSGGGRARVDGGAGGFDAGPAPDSAGVDASMRTDGGRDSGIRECSGCGANQVCSEGVCTDLPATCPCPVESYCDLASNRCVAGCVGDTECATGRYCDVATRSCEDGCRNGECGANATCAPSRVCECDAGHHRCDGTCVPEGLSSCGDACVVCPTDPFGSASCGVSGCELECNAGYLSCGGSCAPCPGGATSYACNGAECVAADCAPTQHICSGVCETMGIASCGESCATCTDTVSGVCHENMSCFGMVDMGLVGVAASCDVRCARQGRTCADACEGMYGGTYVTDFGSGGTLTCDQRNPSSRPTTVGCCCSDEVTGPLMPECMRHDDCPDGYFCRDDTNECARSVDSRCPTGFRRRSSCSNGTPFCVNEALPSGTMYRAECPAGTTSRGGFFCSITTHACVPND